MLGSSFVDDIVLAYLSSSLNSLSVDFTEDLDGNYGSFLSGSSFLDNFVLTNLNLGSDTVSDRFLSISSISSLMGFVEDVQFTFKSASFSIDGVVEVILTTWFLLVVVLDDGLVFESGSSIEVTFNGVFEVFREFIARVLTLILEVAFAFSLVFTMIVIELAVLNGVLWGFFGEFWELFRRVFSLIIGRLINHTDLNIFDCVLEVLREFIARVITLILGVVFAFSLVFTMIVIEMAVLNGVFRNLLSLIITGVFWLYFLEILGVVRIFTLAAFGRAAMVATCST